MKKMHLRRILIAAAILILLPSIAQASGLLSNPDFESGTGDWPNIPNWVTSGFSGAHHTEFNYTPDGSKAIKIWYGDTEIYQDFVTTAGTSYAVSSYAYSSSADPVAGWDGLLKVEWWNNGSKISEEEIGWFYGDSVDACDTWKFISRNITAPAGIDAGRVVIQLVGNGNPTGGAIGWDDIDVTTIEPIPMPNAINNHSFETGNLDWWFPWMIDGNSTGEANRYGFYSVNTALPDWVSEGALLQEFTNFTAGDPIYASVWIKTCNFDGFARLKLEFWNGGSQISSYETTPSDSNHNWTQKSISTIVPQGTTVIKYLLHLSNDMAGTSGEVYFDDAYLSTSEYEKVKIGVNCGGDEYQALDGKLYSADKPLYHDWDYGHEYRDYMYGNLYGDSEYTADMIDGTEDDVLYQTGKWGEWLNYRFNNVCNGIYKVTLKFAEVCFGEGDQSGEQQRIFQVRIEEETVLDELDICKAVGHDYALDYSFLVEVKDEEFSICSGFLKENPKFSAIYVEELDWSETPPAVPTNLKTMAENDVVFVTWDRNNDEVVYAYEVYRSSDGGVTFIKTGRVNVPWYKDTDIISGNTYHYYVKAIDYFDNESAPADPVTAVSASGQGRDFWSDIPECTWKRYLGDIPQESLSKNPNRGIALGGFGAGSFMYNIAGSFGPWVLDITGKGYKKLNLDNAAFHVYQKIGDEPAVVKTLSTDEKLKSAWSKLKAGDGTYHALHPKGWVTYDCFPTDISCEFYSPIIANNYKETSYPVAVWEWKLSNPTSQTAEMSIMLTWPNVEGIYFNNIRKGFQSAYVSADNVVGVVLKASDEQNGVETQNSEWCISTMNNVFSNCQVSYVTSWNSEGDGSDVWNDFVDDGVLNNADLDNSKSAGAIACKVTLSPGETVTVPIVISWDMPVVEFDSGTQWWKKYCEYFDRNSDNSFDISYSALYNNKFIQWRKLIDGWMNPFIYNTDYPEWVKTAAFNELYYMQFGSCFYESGLKSGHDQEFMGLHEEDNKHFLLECQQYENASPSDVRHYYAILYASLWPDIEKEKLKIYADAVIHYEFPFDPDMPDGVMIHDFGDPRGDPFFVFDAYRQVAQGMSYWKDTPSRFIQQCWRYYYMYEDKEFLDYVWPACKATYGFMKTTDLNGNYLPNNDGIDNTYDGTDIRGSSTFCSSLWIGALEAMREMAKIEGDGDIINETGQWLYHARISVENELWKEIKGYYIKDTESSSSEAIMTDALNGQLYCMDWGLEDVLPQDRMISHFQKVYEHCVVPMKDFDGDGVGDVGAINFIMEDGTLLWQGQSDGIWTGVTYFTAAIMHKLGLINEAMQMAYGVYYTTYQEESTAFWFNTPEEWSGQVDYCRPLDPSQYMRAMAIWEYLFSLRNPVNKGIAAASSSGNDFVANNVLDGDLNTRWSSDAADPQWIYIYFLTPKKFNTVRLDWEAAYGRQYEIQVSDDGVSWTTIYTETDGDGGTDIVELGQQAARYVRMYGIERGTGWGYSLYEFSVYSATAMASSEDSPEHSADKAIDSDFTSRWASNRTDDEWIYIDLSKQKTFDTIKLFWEGAYGKQYEIQISNDAANWATIHTETDSDGEVDVIYVGTQTARYVKMRGIQRATTWGYSLWEFEVLKAYASSIENADCAACNAIDDDISTRWTSNWTDNEWLCVDYMRLRDFDTVTLNWEVAYGSQYEIQVSDDGANWTTIYTETNGDGGTDVLYVGQQSARYIRMYGIERGTGWGYSLYEFFH